MIRLSHVGGAALAAAATLAIVVASHVPIPVHPSEAAMLRVAWSARPERVESCRTLSEEELSALPQHMRQRVVCEGTTASYRFEVRREGEIIASSTVRGGGMRHDRQLYIFRELPIPSGRSTLEVRLTRIDSTARPTGDEEDDDDDIGDGGDGEDRAEGHHRDDGDESAPRSGSAADHTESDERARREIDERRRRDEDAVPPSLVLREGVVLAPRAVLLVTYDRDARRLRTVRGTH